MGMIFLDTDVMIDLLREYPPAVTLLESISEEEIVLPGFVVMELIQGSRNKGEQERIKKAPIGAISRLTCSHNQKAYLIPPLIGSYAYP
jgi:predicted nucleic acid-binding protein